MKNHLISGGCGFVGRNMVKRLYNTTNDRIIFVDDLSVGTEPETCLDIPLHREVKGRKIYGEDENKVKALDNVSFSIEKGEVVLVVGSSGSGKSTLLNMIGLLDHPTNGKIFIDGIDTTTLNDNEISSFRNKKLGFIFQFSKDFLLHGRCFFPDTVLLFFESFYPELRRILFVVQFFF